MFIRHGETDWNAEGRLQGHRDIPLNARGRAQARAAGRRAGDLLKAMGSAPERARFEVSPLGRTRETAELARTAMGLPAAGYACEPRLIEFSFGAWEGLTWPEVKLGNAAALRQRHGDKWRFVPPGGESYAQLADRVTPWLATVTDDLVVVSHGGVARALMALIGGLSVLAAPNTEVLQGRVLRFFGGGFAWR